MLIDRQSEELILTPEKMRQNRSKISLRTFYLNLILD